jgi:tRNA(Ile)-lysidine synthase
MTSSLPWRVHHAIRQHELCTPESRVLVGLSGGADSVALTFLLRELAGRGALALVGLAHLNHDLRQTAARDEEFCRALADRVGVPITVERADVRGLAARESLSLEDAARRLRYGFLARVSDTVGADRIAVGHTEDDQAETVLLRLSRGAGLTGLAGIHPRRDRVVRPLIGVPRADLRKYLADLDEAWVEDETNLDLDNPRNRIRHRVLPELGQALGGAAGPAIARAARLAREDGSWLDAIAGDRFMAIARTGPDGLELASQEVMAEPLPIRRRILLQALRMAAPGREIGLDHVDSALAVLEGTARAADVPGSRLELLAGKLVLLTKPPSAS